MSRLLGFIDRLLTHLDNSMVGMGNAALGQVIKERLGNS